MLELGILDFGYAYPPYTEAKYVVSNILDTCLSWEEIGYKRIWLAEHYNPLASWGNPELMISEIAARTTKINVGAAGILIAYNNPFRVYQSFQLLNMIHNGRIDLGIARGGVFDAYKNALGFSDNHLYHNLFTKNLKELESFFYLNNNKPNAALNLPLPSGPHLGQWLLTNSKEMFSTGLGGNYNLCISLFHKPVNLKECALLLNEYRELFIKNKKIAPRCAAALECICLDDKNEIHSIKKILNILNTKTFPRFIIGTPDECINQIAEVQQFLNADEIIVVPKYMDMNGTLTLRNETLRQLGLQIRLS